MSKPVSHDDQAASPPPNDSQLAIPGVSPHADQNELLHMISELAAGAAHEINNPLTIISGRAQLMRERAKTPQEKKTWQQITEQSQRISRIMTQLMQFASPTPPQPETIKIAKLVEAVNFLLSSTNYPNFQRTKFDKSIEDKLPEIWADRTQIEAVLQELVTNAVTAAPLDPYIRITAKAVQQGRFVKLCVEDKGAGMDEKTLSSAFTPFFSSQSAGRRRGLGLPMAWRYVVNNQGTIWIHSAVGQGTRVFVLLPTAE